MVSIPNKTTVFLLMSILLCLSTKVNAQFKFEKEYRIKTDVVPKSAIDFVNNIHPDLNIKWYLETGLNSTSIEAKFNHNKTLFSVEFDTLGRLQDVEYIIKKSDIPSPVYNKIKQNLDSLYQKWSFKKTQINYTGIPDKIITNLKNKEENTAVTITYEIVLKAIKNKKRGQYQLTYNQQGTLEDVYEILQDKSDHLEY